MRTWKTTTVLAIAALFVTVVSAASRWAQQPACDGMAPVVVEIEEPARIVDTGLDHGDRLPEDAMIPEVHAVPPPEHQALEHHFEDSCPACGMG